MKYLLLIVCNIHVSKTPLHIEIQLANASKVLIESHQDSHISCRIYEICRRCANYESTVEAPASNMHAHLRGGRHDRGNFQRRGMNENKWGVKAFDNLCLHFFKLEVGWIQRAPRQVLMLRQRATADLQALLCTKSMRVRVRGYLAAVALPNCSPKGR